MGVCGEVGGGGGQGMEASSSQKEESKVTLGAPPKVRRDPELTTLIARVPG